MKRSAINLLSLAVVAAGVLSLTTPSIAVADTLAAKCTKTVTLPDGSSTTVTLEGDTCSTDIEKGTCTCSTTR